MSSTVPLNSAIKSHHDGVLSVVEHATAPEAAPKMPLDKKISVIADQALKNDRSASQSVKDFFKRVWSVIVSGFEKIKNCFEKCLDAGDYDDLDTDEDSQDSDYYVSHERVVDSNKSLKSSKTDSKEQSCEKKLTIFDPSKVVPAQRKPVAFDNKNNNCWFHAALCMINALDDAFFDIVDQKYQEYVDQKDEIDAYPKALQEYNELKKQFDQETQCYESYKQELNDYEEKAKSYIAKLDAAIVKNDKQFAEDVSKWANSDRSTPCPNKDDYKVECDDTPLPPPFVTKPKNAPVKPQKTFLSDAGINLVRALKEYKQALDCEKEIKAKAQKLHDALVEYNKSIGSEFGAPGQQEDAAEFFDVIFGLISNGLFSTSTRKKAVVSGKTFYSRPEVTPENKLVIALPKKGSFTLQDLIDNHFSTEHFSASSKDPYMEFTAYNKNGEAVDGDNVRRFKSAQSKTRIQSPAPEFFIIQAKRFATEMTSVPSHEQIINEVLSKLPDIDNPSELVRHGIKKYEELRKKHESSKPQYYQTKINTPIGMPKNCLINFAKAFGKKDAEEGYEYQITSVVIQRGEIGGGHYTAAVQHMDDETGENVWSYVNDIGVRIKTIKPENLLNTLSLGYIFLLRKVKKVDIAPEDSDSDESVDECSDSEDSEDEDSNNVMTKNDEDVAKKGDIVENKSASEESDIEDKRDTVSTETAKKEPVKIAHE